MSDGDAGAVDSQLNPDLMADLFERRIKPDVFGHRRPSAVPRLVLLGGQPAAGKSYAMGRLTRDDPDVDLVVLTGDTLRPFHPHYPVLLRTDPLAMPNATGPAVAAWVRGCIDHALAERFSLVLESTFRDAGVVSSTVRRFAQAGYRTEAVILAVRPERSRLDGLLRYLRPDAPGAARWTPPTAHDTSFARLPDTVRAMQDVADLHRITVQTRAGTVFANERGPVGRWQHPGRAHEVLAVEHDRPFDPPDALEWLSQYRQVIEAADELPSIDPKALPTYLALFQDADRIAPMATPNLDNPRHRLHAETQRRARAMLMRHDPSLDRPRGPGSAAGRAFPPLPGAHPNAQRQPTDPPPSPGQDTTQHRRR